jgi:hypothetical protein
MALQTYVAEAPSKQKNDAAAHISHLGTISLHGMHAGT